MLKVSKWMKDEGRRMQGEGQTDRHTLVIIELLLHLKRLKSQNIVANKFTQSLLHV